MTKIREVLEDVFNKGCSPLLREMTVDQAHSAILSAVEEMLPKEFNSHHRSNEGYNRDYVTGYNKAIADMKEKLKNEANNERSE